MKRLAIAFFVTTALTAHAQYFTSWPHDARAVVRWGAVAPQLVAAINATRYEGRYNTGSPICSHYDIAVSVDPNRTQVKDLSQLLWDNPGSSFCARVEAQLVLRADVSGCPSLGTSVGCMATTCLSANQDLVPIFGGCRLGLLPAVGFSSSIALPFAFAGEIPFDLGTEPDAPTHISFGTFSGGTWQDAGPKKAVAAGGRTLGLQGRPATDWDTDSPDPNSDKTRGNALLASDHVIGVNAFRPRANAAEIVADVRADQPFIDADFAALSLSPSFFLRQYPDGSRSGLFGELLPMRVLHSQKLPNGKFVNFELFITNGGVTFTTVENRAAIALRLSSDHPIRAWLSDVAGGSGSSLAVEKVGIEAILHPEITASQSLQLQLDQFEVKLQFAKELPSLNTCILTSLLQASLSQAQQKIDLGQIHGKISVATPDCISVGLGNVQAARPCSEFGNAVNGYLSNIHPGGTRIDIALDLPHARFAVANGIFVIGIPRQ